MNVLVTGANGLLGSNLIRLFSKKGYNVRGMVRSSSKLISLKGVEFEKYVGDILDPKDVVRAARGCQVIVHSAANTKQWPTCIKNYTINIQGTQNVIHAAKQVGTERFIYVSTANTFGFGTKEDPGNEQSEFKFFNLKSGYIQSKYKAQQIVLEEVENNELPAIVVNPTFMLGLYDSRPSSGTIILSPFEKRSFVYPPGGKNFIHVRDVAAGILNAIYMGRIGECYILGHQNLTYKEFFEKVINIASIKTIKFKIPSFLLKTFGISGSFCERLFQKGSPLANYSNSRLLCLGNYYSAEKAVNELNLPQTPIEYAIFDALDWFKANGYINKYSDN